MEHRQVGRTGLALSVLGFGCGPVGGLYARIDEAQANATLAAALDAGITYFDTAPFYGAGLAEHRLGASLRGRRAGLAISTKVGRLLHAAGPDGPEPGMFADALPFDVRYDYSRDGILRSVEDSLQRIGTDRVDILYVHDLNHRWHGDDLDRRLAEFLDSGYGALERLRAEGRVRAIGAGMNDPNALCRLAEAGDFDLFMLAGRYTLLDQSSLDRFFPTCARRGVSVVSAGPYNSGVLAHGARAGAKFFYADAPAENPRAHGADRGGVRGPPRAARDRRPPLRPPPSAGGQRCNRNGHARRSGRQCRRSRRPPPSRPLARPSRGRSPAPGCADWVISPLKDDSANSERDRERPHGNGPGKSPTHSSKISGSLSLPWHV